MSDLVVTTQNSSLSSIREFLRNKSNELAQSQYCPNCGSLMAFMAARFWLNEDEEFWDIPLPFCLHCHPEITTRITPAA